MVIPMKAPKVLNTRSSTVPNLVIVNVAWVSSILKETKKPIMTTRMIE